MPSLPVLLRSLDTLHRERAAVDVKIAAVEREIIDTHPEPKPRAKRSTAAEVAEVVRATVKVLRDAGTPLPRREIASRLGVTPWAASYRLQLAIKAKFVESIGSGRYRVSSAVPAF